MEIKLKIDFFFNLILAKFLTFGFLKITNTSKLIYMHRYLTLTFYIYITQVTM